MAEKKIDKLTPAQERRVSEYLEKYEAIGLDTKRCDRAKAEQAVRESYRELKLGAIEKFVWFENPWEGAKYAARLALTENKDYLKTGVLHERLPTREQIKEQAQKASYGSFEAYWVAFYAFIEEVLEVDPHPLVPIAKNIVAECGAYWTFEGLVVMTEKPAEIHLKDMGDGKKVLHNTNGKALRYHDDTGLYAVNGEIFMTFMEMTMAAKYEGGKKK